MPIDTNYSMHNSYRDMRSDSQKEKGELQNLQYKKEHGYQLSKSEEKKLDSLETKYPQSGKAKGPFEIGNGTGAKGPSIFGGLGGAFDGLSKLAKKK